MWIVAGEAETRIDGEFAGLGRELRSLPLLELAFAVYFLLGILYSVRLHMWGTIPFLLLFFFGFGYMGVMSLLQTASGKRLSTLWRPLKPSGARQ